jgi:hypothetical protein
VEITDETIDLLLGALADQLQALDNRPAQMGAA